MRDLDQGHGRAAGDHVDAAGAAEGERRGPGPGDDHQGRRAAGGQDHRLREVQVSPSKSKVLSLAGATYLPTIGPLAVEQSGFGLFLAERRRKSCCKWTVCCRCDSRGCDFRRCFACCFSVALMAVGSQSQGGRTNVSLTHLKSTVPNPGPRTRPCCGDAVGCKCLHIVWLVHSQRPRRPF